jgi:DNA polymerase elongation subunit (family B)
MTTIACYAAVFVPIQETGKFVLERILSGEARETVVESIHEHLRGLAAAMREGHVPIAQFVITKSISKQPQDYPNAKNEPHLQVLKLQLLLLWLLVALSAC